MGNLVISALQVMAVFIQNGLSVYQGTALLFLEFPG